ncbi:MAG: hypothetical protein PHR53_09275, partial [Bacteroidales bacterium]|nr:hypothetical protein [Bacteroidales bacterium]
AARKLAEQEINIDNATSTPIKKSEHILLPITKHSNIAMILDFAILLKDKQSSLPISMLSVVPYNDKAEWNIVKAKNKLEHFVNQGSSAEVIVDTLVTIDHHLSDGIARISQEIMADTIVLEWPTKLSGVIDKLMGDTMNRVLKRVDKNIFICRIDVPLVKNKRILLLTTPFAELESGFEQWFLKLVKLSNELSIPIEHLGNEETKNGMLRVLLKNQINANIHSDRFFHWHDFQDIEKHIFADDLIVLVSSREGFVSYLAEFEQLTDKLTLHLFNNKIAVYPHQTHDYSIDVYEDISSETITSGWKNLQKLGRNIRNFFKIK